MTIRTIGLLLALCALAGCASAGNGEPAWLGKKIEEFRSAPVTNPPRAVYKATYEGKNVFYVPPRCCDIPDQLYSEEGTLLCAPSGGIAGTGDGRCPAFFEGGKKQPNMQLIWQDDREQNRPGNP